jgi:hypothetical protein
MFPSLSSLSPIFVMYILFAPMLLILGEWSKHIGVSAANELDGSCWFPVPNDTGSAMLSRCDQSALHSTRSPGLPGQTIVRSGWKYNAFVFF